MGQNGAGWYLPKSLPLAPLPFRLRNVRSGVGVLGTSRVTAQVQHGKSCKNESFKDQGVSLSPGLCLESLPKKVVSLFLAGTGPWKSSHTRMSPPWKGTASL